MEPRLPREHGTARDANMQRDCTACWSTAAQRLMVVIALLVPMPIERDEERRDEIVAGVD